MRSDPLDIDRLVRETFVAQVEHHARLRSTNDRALQCAAEGTAWAPLLIVADEQTAGRGRGTNRWWTGRGSLACSLLLEAGQAGGVQPVEPGSAPSPNASTPPPLNPRKPAKAEARGRPSPLVALAAGVAVVKTARPLLGDHVVGLHWPNDVFVAGRKLAGVLVEVSSAGRVVMGIGANLNNSLRDAPEELRTSATTVFELTGIRHPRTQILLALLGHLAEGLAVLGSAPGEIAAEADRLCLQQGKTLTVRQGQRVVSGRCAGIASDGALLVDGPAGRQRLYSGVVR